MKEITFKTNDSGITINIQTDILVHVAENHPESPLKINDPIEFAKQVTFQLEYNLGSEDSGLTGFQKLIDEAIYEVGCSGLDCADIKEIEP